MKDYLLDLIQYTHGLGCINTVKIEGTDTETKISAAAADLVVITGEFKQPVADFIGTFGMPNLSTLKTIVNFEEYGEGATIELRRGREDDPASPESIHFENKTGDFINDYRLMAKATVNGVLPPVTFRGAAWDISFEPTNDNISRLKKQANASSEETNFKFKVENGDLKVYFGEHYSHSGNFVFQSNVSGNLSKARDYPVKIFLSVVELAGNKKISISDAGVIKITVDSGLADYQYLIPALAK
jgi:hypothetical protein